MNRSGAFVKVKAVGLYTMVRAILETIQYGLAVLDTALDRKVTARITGF